MKTARRMTTAAVLCAFSAFAATMRAQADPAPAANPVLKAIPDDALGFAIINNLGQTDKAISKWAAAVQGSAPSVLTMLKLQAGIQDGLDENGSVVIALLPDKAGEAAKPAPYPVVFLPVTDYKKFVAQFQPGDAAAETTGVMIAGHAMVVGHKDSFAVFTLPDHKAQLAKVIASNKGVDSLLGSFEPWIGRHQVSIVATPTGTKMALQAASAGLNQAQAAMARLQTAQQTAQFNSILQAYETIIAKAGGEMEAFGVGLRLDDSSNLSIDSHTTLVAGGAWAAAMKDLKPSEESRFAGIQAKPFAIAFEGIWPEKWSDAMADWSASLTASMSTVNGGAEMDQQQRKTYVDAMRSMMKGLRAMSFVMAAPKPGGSMYDGVVASMKVDNAPSFLVQYQKSMEQLLEVSKGQKNSPFKFSEVKKIEIDGQSGLAITMDLSGMLASMNNPATAKLMPLLFGPTGKLTMRILSADDHTLIAAYGSEDHAKEALAAYKNPQSSLASDPDVATTLKLLPPHAQWIGLLSVKGYVDMISGLMSAVAPGGVPIKLPEFPGTAPIGFAAEMNSLGLDTQLVVPAVTIASMNKFFQAVTGPHAAPGGAIPPGPPHRQ